LVDMAQLCFLAAQRVWYWLEMYSLFNVVLISRAYLLVYIFSG